MREQQAKEFLGPGEASGMRCQDPLAGLHLFLPKVTRPPDLMATAAVDFVFSSGA